MDQNRGEEYISAFPEFKKWINECVCCHAKGYNPSMPQKIGQFEGNLGAYFIRKYFKPLRLDEHGLCLLCAKLFKDE